MQIFFCRSVSPQAKRKSPNDAKRFIIAATKNTKKEKDDEEE